MAKVYQFPAGGRAGAAAGGAPARPVASLGVAQVAEAQAFIAMQPKMFRDDLREITARSPGPFTAVAHDEERSLIVDGQGRPVTEDLFHRSHARYVAEFLNQHASDNGE
tara:strand:- start:375 stop:701 length:327 start_codon:yes stop_codon:yes gene_type:complete